MNINEIKKALEKYDPAKVEIYTNYLMELVSAKDKGGKLKNPWIQHKTDGELVAYFKKVDLDGLSIDGTHITLQSTGVSYDFTAYKNKLLMIYPGALFDFGIVYKDDGFKFSKQSGEIIYQHEINNPFGQNEKDIIGAYCIIRCKRGNFLTLLSRAEIEKHRAIARTDYIWKSWYREMCLKTVIKKACKQNFQDIFTNVEVMDNTQYDLESPLDIDIEDKGKIETINTIKELKEYYNKHKGKNAGVLKSFNKLISVRKAEIEAIEKAVKAQKDKDDSVRQPGDE